MSKEEILKIQTCVLKVNIHCDGCERKVRKILQKIDGVFKTSIDSEMGKVTVSGNVDPATLIKKLGKNGKHAEVWGAASKPNQNQFKNNQIESGKGGPNKGQKGGNNHPKGGGGGGQNQQHQLKALQDLKLPQFKGMKFPFGGKDNQNQKSVKFNLPPQGDDLSDDDYDEEEFDDDDGEFDDLDYDDDYASHVALNKMKLGNGQQMGNMMSLNSQQHAQFMDALAKGGGGSGNGKKGGGGGNIPVQVNDGKNGGGGKKGGGGGNGNNNNQSQGGGGAGKNGGKNGGGGQNKSGTGGGGSNGGGAKKGGGNGMNDGVQAMLNGYNAMGGGNAAAHMAKMNMGQLGQMGGNIPVGQMPAVQGLPAGAMAGAGGGGGVGRYFNGAGPEIMAGNPYYQQQQLAAAMMNQQRANGNERFQPMMYARPPPAVNYMPPYPYPYPPPADPYIHAFSDENTSSCSVM